MRNIYVDWLRGLSIFCVMVTHHVLSYRLIFFVPKEQAMTMAKNGGYGVTIFFVISGFLITSKAMEKWGSPDAVVPSDFYANRVARILPLLLLFLFFCIMMFCFSASDFVPENGKLLYQAVSAALTFQYNTFYFTIGNVPGLYPMSPLWSLAIEETFYLAFPLIMILLRRKTLIALALCIIVLQGPASRDASSFYSLWGSVDAMAIGCLAAFAAISLREIRHHRLLPALMMLTGLAVLIATMALMPLTSNAMMGPTIIGFGAFIFLLGTSIAKPVDDWTFPKLKVPSLSPALILMPLAAMGALSYELYLFHVSFRFLSHLKEWPARWHFANSLIALLCLCTFAYLIQRFFADPAGRFIKRLYENFREDSRAHVR